MAYKIIANTSNVKSKLQYYSCEEILKKNLRPFLCDLVYMSLKSQKPIQHNNFCIFIPVLKKSA